MCCTRLAENTGRKISPKIRQRTKNKEEETTTVKYNLPTQGGHNKNVINMMVIAYNDQCFDAIGLTTERASGLQNMLFHNGLPLEEPV